jgi:hypothetical protein
MQPGHTVAKIPSIDEQGCAGHEARGRAGEEQHGAVEFLLTAETFDQTAVAHEGLQALLASGHLAVSHARNGGQRLLVVRSASYQSGR